MSTTQVTHPEALVPSDQLTAVDDADALASLTESLSEDEAEAVLNVHAYRVDMRSDDRTDIIVTLADWAVEENDFPTIADSPALLIGHVEDHSEKSYHARGAFEVDLDHTTGMSDDEIQDDFINRHIDQIDRTDTDYVDSKGETYLPKSAVDGLFIVN